MLLPPPLFFTPFLLCTLVFHIFLQGCEICHVSNVLIPILWSLLHFFKQRLLHLIFSQHCIYLQHVLKYTRLTCNSLMHCCSNPLIRIDGVVVKKEVCRLEISGGQLLQSCCPGHFNNLVNANECQAE